MTVKHEVFPASRASHLDWCLPAKASLFYLKDNRMIDYIPDDESIRAFSERRSRLIQAIHAEEFSVMPGQTCRYCDYGTLCEVKKKGGGRANSH